jgi:fatty acid desaturase
VYLNALGVLLTWHALVFSAYLLHDCMHGTVFKSNAGNARAGLVLTWLNGACYAPYESLRDKHMRHHVDKADVVSFDYRALLRRHPRLGRLVAALEWAYLPAVELLMHTYVIAAPFVSPAHRRRRGRVLWILTVRAALFLLLAAISIKALLLYLLAYLLFLSTLRFVDAFQHTYGILIGPSAIPLPESERRDAAYEQRHTYSNLLSSRYPPVNLLTLNFVYHNAHHARPIVPWYRLPALHRELFGADERQVIPARRLLRNFHRYRVARIAQEDYGAVDTERGDTERFVGADGVSFLTAI